MPFYAHPTAQLSPGDIFPSIPFSIPNSPLKIGRISPYNPAKGRAPAEFRRIYSPAELNDLKLSSREGEETFGKTRLCMAIFLTWGSDVDADEASIASRDGRVGTRGWLAAPVFELSQIPESDVAIDPESKQPVLVQDLIRQGKVHHAFYLPPFPEAEPRIERYVELKRITNIGVKFFRDASANRIVTLTSSSLNEMFTQLVWCFTRAEFLFRPVRCECGREIPTDVRFHGQNFDAEPWED